MLSIESAKKQARLLKVFLNEKYSDISHSSCLQALAIINGYQDWNTMQAILKKNDEINDMSDVENIVQRLEDLEFYVKELAQQVDNIQTKVDEHEPYIMELQGINPWNPPD